MPDTISATVAKPSTETARIDRAIMAKVRVVAARRKMSTPDYLNAALRVTVEADYNEELDKMAKERAAEQKRKRD